MVGEQGPAGPLSPTPAGRPGGATEVPGVLEAARSSDSAVRAGEAAAAAAVAAGDSGPPDVPHTDLTAAAFFDVDNTMMIGASIFHFARGLAARKFFTTSDMLGFVWQQLKFRVGGRELSYGHTTGRDTTAAARPACSGVTVQARCGTRRRRAATVGWRQVRRSTGGTGGSRRAGSSRGRGHRGVVGGARRRDGTRPGRPGR